MRKTEAGQKIGKNGVLGTIFLLKDRFFGDFGVPGVSLGELLGRILGRKVWDEKKTKKTSTRGLASAGDAYPGKEGFREDKGQGGLI